MTDRNNSLKDPRVQEKRDNAPHQTKKQFQPGEETRAYVALVRHGQPDAITGAAILGGIGE